MNLYYLFSSYLNIFEEADLKVEEDYFSSHSSRGVLYKKPIVGTLIAPPENDEAAIKVWNESVQTNNSELISLCFSET